MAVVSPCSHTLLYLKWVFYVDHHTGKVISPHQPKFKQKKKKNNFFIKLNRSLVWITPFHRVNQTSFGCFLIIIPFSHTILPPPVLLAWLFYLISFTAGKSSIFTFALHRLATAHSLSFHYGHLFCSHAWDWYFAEWKSSNYSSTTPSTA